MSIDARPNINVKDIVDRITQRNFQNLRDYFHDQGQLLDFQFFELIFTGAETARKVVHSLGYTPKDVIVTRVTGTGSATFLFGKFDSTAFYVTASGKCRVRCFVGTRTTTSEVNSDPADFQTYSAQPTTNSSTTVNNTTVNSASTYKAPTRQTFLSGTGTYTTPTGVLYLRVVMIGGGGGGGATNASTVAGGTGGTTTFGTSLLSCIGGGGATTGVPTAGGTATITAPATGNAWTGGTGHGGGVAGSAGSANTRVQGAPGACSPFGGAGSGGTQTTNAGDAIANTGSGGGGSGGSNVANIESGAGGSAGGYIDALITSPAATYAYAVGAGGTKGTSAQQNGGTGGSGIIIVEEYYQ